MRRSTDRLVVVCVVVSVLCAIVTVLVVAPTVLDTSKRTDDTAKLAADTARVTADNARLSRENAARTRDVARLARAIQRQRVDSILRNCKAQNGRHANTIRALDVLISRLPPGPERVRAKANRKGTVFLLNQIVPYQNCRKLVAKTAPTP